GILGAIRRAIDEPPAHPVVPPSALAGYSGTPLPKKLSIKPGTTVGLIGAPPGFARALGALPEGACIAPAARGKCTVVVWFFDGVLAAQEADERGPFRSYAEITARSLEEAAGLDPARARAVAAGIGLWPFYPDSRDALAGLLRRVPCVAMTNSDRLHGAQIQT